MSGQHWVIVASLAVCYISCHRPSTTNFVQVEDVQLSRPHVRVDEVFFPDSTTVYLSKPPAGCLTYFTNDGQPPNLHSSVAGDSILVGATSLLRFRNIGGGYQASEEVDIELFRLHSQIHTIETAATPKAPYDQSASVLLIDQQKGSANFRDGRWLGYQMTSLLFELTFDGSLTKGITLSVMEDQNSWIFAPDSLAVQFYDETDTLLTQAHMTYDAARVKNESAFRFLSLEVDSIRPVRARLFINNLAAIPEWHPGSGHTPWLFIDEIILR